MQVVEAQLALARLKCELVDVAGLEALKDAHDRARLVAGQAAAANRLLQLGLPAGEDGAVVGAAVDLVHLDLRSDEERVSAGKEHSFVTSAQPTLAAVLFLLVVFWERIVLGEADRKLVSPDARAR